MSAKTEASKSTAPRSYLHDVVDGSSMSCEDVDNIDAWPAGAHVCHLTLDAVVVLQQSEKMCIAGLQDPGQACWYAHESHVEPTIRPQDS